MKKLVLILVCAVVIPFIAVSFSSCKKKTYTCVCVYAGIRTTYEVSAISKSKAEDACNDQSGTCAIE
jgi:hypothetical protein